MSWGIVLANQGVGRLSRSHYDSMGFMARLALLESIPLWELICSPPSPTSQFSCTGLCPELTQSQEPWLFLCLQTEVFPQLLSPEILGDSG